MAAHKNSHKANLPRKVTDTPGETGRTISRGDWKDNTPGRLEGQYPGETGRTIPRGDWKGNTPGRLEGQVQNIHLSMSFSHSIHQPIPLHQD